MTSTAAQTKRDQQDDAAAKLREVFPVGSTVTTMVRYVSRSGMRRAVVVLAPTATVPGYGTDDPHAVTDLSWLVARALGWPLHRTEGGVQVDGCGMDMTYHLVYTLAQTIYGDGYALGHRNLH